MKKTLASLILMTAVVSSPSYALFGLSDESTDSLKSAASSMGVDTSSVDKITDVMNSGEQGMQLVNQLTDQLGISTKQAAGGSAALLALAQENLSSENMKALSESVPGLDTLLNSSDSLDSITNLSSVKSVFEQLGLDSDMVSQFTPIIQSYLEGQGVDSSLLSALSSAWSAK